MESIFLEGIPNFYHETSLGTLYEDDCLRVLPYLRDESVDVVFADPPFNIGKVYGPSFEDNLTEDDYLLWCHSWMSHCVRILKTGGSFFLYNIPKWNIILGNYLNTMGMDFRHWVAVDMRASFPIKNKLYPSHYSLLYYSKGKPKTFNKVRTPIETCRHCHKELRDYGGHRDKMKATGVNLTDVWRDIPVVRHKKYKSAKRGANQLSTKMIRRILELSSSPGDVVCDPFGGSGTTFSVCEKIHRHWIGIEIDHAEVIVERLQSDTVVHHPYTDFIEISGESDH